MDEIESKREMRVDLDLEIELGEPTKCIFNLRFQLKKMCVTNTTKKKKKKKEGKIIFWSLNFAKDFFF